MYQKTIKVQQLQDDKAELVSANQELDEVDLGTPLAPTTQDAEATQANYKEFEAGTTVYVSKNGGTIRVNLWQDTAHTRGFDNTSCIALEGDKLSNREIRAGSVNGGYRAGVSFSRNGEVAEVCFAQRNVTEVNFGSPVLVPQAQDIITIGQ